ncbi:MAG: hypothetical protein ACK484_11685 [Sphingobacteriales bacterium]|jgi:hypothetical protein
MTEKKLTLQPSEKAIDLNGKWYGFYQYGSEYGPLVEGARILFSITIEQKEDRSFTGKCVELEGIGVNTEVARLQGYIDDTFISFVKHYRKHQAIDEQGKDVDLGEVSSTRLMYSGTIDRETDIITGKWEIWVDRAKNIDNNPGEVTTGVWEISRDPSKYGI